MSNLSLTRIEGKFHPLTKETAKQWYKHQHLTTTGYLLAIKGILRAPGSNLRIPNVVEFCKEWEIGKSAFYRAVNALKASGELDWEATEGIILKSRNEEKVVSILLEEEKCPTSGKVSHERDAQSHERDTQSHERDAQSHERDTDIYIDHARAKIQIFTDFIETLSNSERENFLEFGKKQAAQMPHKVVLPEKWIASNWEEVRSQWEASAAGQKVKEKVEAAAADWPNHPQFEEWLNKCYFVGRLWTMEDSPDQAERTAFFNWAQKTNAYVGRIDGAT